VTTLATAADGSRELIVGCGDIPPRLLAAVKRQRQELIALVAAIDE
jgi:hypothetical protein